MSDRPTKEEMLKYFDWMNANYLGDGTRVAPAIRALIEKYGDGELSVRAAIDTLESDLKDMEEIEETSCIDIEETKAGLQVLQNYERRRQL